MNKEEFDALIDAVLEMGITISLSRKDGITKYDLNTGMKSHLVVYHKDGETRFEGRYDAKGTVSSLDDLLIEVRDCRHGRTFASSEWVEAFDKMDWPLFKTTTVKEMSCI